MLDFMLTNIERKKLVLPTDRADFKDGFVTLTDYGYLATLTVAKQSTYHKQKILSPSLSFSACTKAAKMKRTFFDVVFL